MNLSATLFQPAWWLPNPHLQTLWAALCHSASGPPLRRERLELPDSDFLDLDWTLGEDAPIVIILHGLEGSSRSSYVQGLLKAVTTRGWRGVVLHFRGCSGEPNRLVRSYNGGDTKDLNWVITTLKNREPNTPLMAVGYSLGGNVLLKWLGERGASTPLKAATAISVPFLLETAARRMRLGLSRLYQAQLLHSLRTSYRAKFARLNDELPCTLQELDQLNDFYRFDDKITAPLHGYIDVYDYYHRASCRRYLKHIQTPTLIIHAKDDPFMRPEAIPHADELSSHITLELNAHGGHVGFVSGPPWRPVYWLEQRIPAFFDIILNQEQSEGANALRK